MSDKNPLVELVIWVFSFIAVLVASVVIWVVSSYFEAAAFNNATGKNVSTWDAMFIELRIQEQTK